MPNPNYLKGRRFEYDRMRYWKETCGAQYVARTAGSHSAYDLIVIDARGETLLIQCKCVKTPAEANRLINAFRNNPPHYVSYVFPTQVLEVKIDGGKIVDTWV